MQRQRIPQLSCVWEEARTILIDAWISLLNTLIMRSLTQSCITTPGSRTRNTMLQLLRAPTIIILVKERETGNIAA